MAEGYYKPALITKIITGSTDSTGNFVLTDINPSNADLISAVQMRNSGGEELLCFCFPCQNYNDTTYMLRIVGNDLSIQANKTFTLRIAYRQK